MYDARDVGSFLFMVAVTPLFVVVLLMSAVVFGPLLLLHELVVRVARW